MRRMLFAALMALVAADASGQDANPNRKPVALDEWIQTVARRLAAEQRGEEPTETARAGKQVTAPSGAATTASVVDAPSFVQVVGLAVDNDLLAFKDGALTTDLNLFAFKALADPSVLVTQEEYGKHVTMRRFGGSITLGGKGEEFDQNGDGTKDKPKETQNITDIVRAELRWRFAGTRDRRDAQSVASYVEALKTVDKELVSGLLALAPTLMQVIRTHDNAVASDKRILEPCAPQSRDECVFNDKVDALTKLVKLALGSQLAAFGSLLEKYDAAHAAAIKEIDRQAIWTAVVNGTNQAAAYGPQRFGFGIRGLFAVGAWDHTLNVDWTRAVWRAGRPIAHSGKIGYSFSRLLSANPEADLVPKLTLAFSGEAFRNVPDAKHDKILTAGLRIDIPFSASVSLPVSLTYASHADLLSDQRLVRGNVGLAWDFSGLSKKKPQKE